MPWPDIFFKARKRPAPPSNESEPPVIEGLPADDVTPTSAEPPPLPLPPPLRAPPSSVPVGSPSDAPPPVAKNPPPERGTRTIPVVHGVVLRPPTGRLTRAAIGAPASPAPPAKPLKNIEQLMAEADPVRTLSQSGGVRMVRRISADSIARPLPTTLPPPMPVPEKMETAPLPPVVVTPPPVAPAVAPPAATEAPIRTPTPSPWPSFQPKNVAPIEMKKIELRTEPVPRADSPPRVEPPRADLPTRAVPPPVPAVVKAPEKDAALRTTVSLTSPPRHIPAGPPPMISVVGRRAKLADVARIVLPPKREETQSLPSPAPEPSPTIVPPTFAVPTATGRLFAKANAPRPDLAAVAAALESPFMDRSTKSAPESKPGTARLPLVPASAKELIAAEPVAETPKPATIEPVAAVQPDLPLTKAKADIETVDAKAPELVVEPAPPAAETAPRIDPQAHASTPTPASASEPEVTLDPEAHKPPADVRRAAPVGETTETARKSAETPVVLPEAQNVVPEKAQVEFTPVPPPAPIEPMVDPEAHKPAASADVAPRIDPEAHKPVPVAGAEITPKPEPREFHLTNGERVAGIVLSETPEAVYVEHATLGVLTIPRSEIARRLVEIILLNGDRIVGDIMAETAEMLYVRHASLGMLSVPRAQRSTRVVEAILKDGDRILGELLAETEAFIVIKSSTLGTVTVPHAKLAMLNRKVEQVEMKSLSAGPAQLTG